MLHCGRTTIATGKFILYDLNGVEKTKGSFQFVEQIARFAPLPDPFSSGPPSAPESWLVTEAGHVPLFFGTGDDHQWFGKRHLFLTEALQFNPRQTIQAIRFGFDPKRNPKALVERQDPNRPFEGLPVMLALSGMHTGDESQETYGISGSAKIEPFQPPTFAPAGASLRPSVEADVGVWGEDANLSSVAFHVTITAEFGFG